MSRLPSLEIRPDATFVAPLPYLEMEAQLRQAPSEVTTEKDAYYSVPAGIVSVPNPNFYDQTPEKQKEALHTMRTWGYDRVIADGLEPPVHPRGNIIGFLRSMFGAIGGIEAPTKDAAPEAQFAGALAGEAAKYVGAARLLSGMGLAGLPLEAGAGAIVGTHRQAMEAATGGEFSAEELAYETGLAAVIPGYARAIGRGLRKTPTDVASEFGVVYEPTARTKAAEKVLGDMGVSGEVPRVGKAPGHRFYDPETDVSFAVDDIADVPTELHRIRNTHIGREPAVALTTFGVTPEGLQSLQRAWAGTVDKAAEKVMTIVPHRIKRFFKGDLPADAEQIMVQRDRAIRFHKIGALRLMERIRGEVPEQYHEELFKVLDPGALGETGRIPIKNFDLAFNIRRIVDDLGEEAVGQGLLDADTYAANFGKYMRRYYEPYAMTEFRRRAQQIMGSFRSGRGAVKVKGKPFLKRKLKTVEEREAMGLIRDPQYVVARTIGDLAYDVETAKALNKIATNPQWAGSEWQAGFSRRPIPNVPAKYAGLAGKYVHEGIYGDVMAQIPMRSEWGNIYDQILAHWKFGKTALNPATHGRNIFSNVILADFGGLPPYRVDVYYRALKEMVKKGKWYKEAEQDGLMGMDWYGAEVEPFLKLFTPKHEGSMLSKAWQIGTVPFKKAGNLYQGEEQWFKLALYMHKRMQGLSRADAAAVAQKHLFDYSRLSPGLRKLQRSPFGAPFLTFTAKALPVIAETAIKRPFKFFKYYAGFRLMDAYSKAALGLSDEEYQKVMRLRPPWLRGGFISPTVLLPFTDKNGNPQILDLTYNMPWGDIAEQGTWLQVPHLGAIAERFVGSSPALRIPVTFMTNVDPFTQRQVANDAELLLGQRWTRYAEHTAYQLAPGILINSKRVKDAIEGKKLRSGEKRDVISTVLSNLAGIKLTPVMQQLGLGIEMWRYKKNVETLRKQMYRIAADQSLSEEEREQQWNQLMNALDDLGLKMEKLLDVVDAAEQSKSDTLPEKGVENAGK